MSKIAFWVETVAPGAGHWGYIFQVYREAKRRGHDAVVISGTYDKATGLFPFDPDDIKQLPLPKNKDAYFDGPVGLLKPDPKAQQRYAEALQEVLAREKPDALITEQLPLACINRSWFFDALKTTCEGYSDKPRSERPVLGGLIRSNSLGYAPEHYETVAGPDVVAGLVRHYDFLAVHGMQKINDLADYHEVAQRPDVKRKVNYTGYLTPPIPPHGDYRRGTLVSSGSNWFEGDNDFFYDTILAAFPHFPEKLRSEGIRILVPRDTPADRWDRIQETAARLNASGLSVRVSHNIRSADFDQALFDNKLAILRPGNSAAEAVDKGIKVITIPQVIGIDPEQMIHAVNLDKLGLAHGAVLGDAHMGAKVRAAAVERIGAKRLAELTLDTPEAFATVVKNMIEHPPKPRLQVRGDGAHQCIDLVENIIEKAKPHSKGWKDRSWKLSETKGATNGFHATRFADGRFQLKLHSMDGWGYFGTFLGALNDARREAGMQVPAESGSVFTMDDRAYDALYIDFKRPFLQAMEGRVDLKKVFRTACDRLVQEHREEQSGWQEREDQSRNKKGGIDGIA